jgi:hypothetical protein
MVVYFTIFDNKDAIAFLLCVIEIKITSWNLMASRLTMLTRRQGAGIVACLREG